MQIRLLVLGIAMYCTMHYTSTLHWYMLVQTVARRYKVMQNIT